MYKLSFLYLHKHSVWDTLNALLRDNYDIKEIRSLLTNIEDILYPGMKENRPDIAYRLAQIHSHDLYGDIQNLDFQSMDTKSDL